MNIQTDLRPGESLAKITRGDCWSMPLNSIQYNHQVPGRYFFTNQRIVFEGGGLIQKLRMGFEIEYKDIAKLSSYYVFVFPFGIRLETKDGRRYRFSVRKRDSHMNMIETFMRLAQGQP